MFKVLEPSSGNKCNLFMLYLGDTDFLLFSSGTKLLSDQESCDCIILEV